MKSSLIAFMCCYSFISTSQYNWSEPIQIDEENGAYSSVHYLENGDLFVFYNTPELISKKQKVKKRMQGQVDFGTEVQVGSFGRSVDLSEWRGDTLFTVYETDDQLKIYLSTNQGDNWSQHQNYESSEAVWLQEAYGKAFFLENNDSLRIVFHHVYNTGVFGAGVQVKSVQMKNGVWDPLLYGFGPGTMTEAVGIADSTIGFTTSSGCRVFNGDIDNYDYFDNNGDGTTPGSLYSSDIDLHNDRIHLIRSFGYGVAPDNMHLNYTYSNDRGATWLSPQSPIKVWDKSFYNAKIVATDDLIHALWVSPNELLDNTYIFHSFSEDNGENWSNHDTIVSLSGSETFDSNFGLSVDNYQNSVGLSYNTLNSGVNSHTYFMELTEDEITSISVNNYNVVELFPNPTQNLLNIKSDQKINHYEIYNLLGEKISSNIYQGSIDVSAYKKGLYFIKIKFNNTYTIQQFIVQ